MYETARDMIKAERLCGHEVEMVDVGIDGKRQIGAVDDRAGCRIEARDYSAVAGFDLYVINCNVPEKFWNESTTPAVQIMHGRPASSFRLQQQKKQPVYDIHARRAADPRLRRFISLWPEHLPFWRAIIPNGKLVSTSAPPVDRDLYAPQGDMAPISVDGRFNILIADLWRDDSDPYFLLNGLIELARQRQDFVLHLYACSSPLGPWAHLINALRRAHVLGTLYGMTKDIAKVYRAVDVTLTGNRIATRIMRESLACGTPIIAPNGATQSVAAFAADDPVAIAAAVSSVIDWWPELKDGCRIKARDASAAFDLGVIGKELDAFYREALQ